MYITITDVDKYLGIDSLKIGQELLLLKDLDNPYDDEAIKVITENGATCGYVANSVEDVARGSHSAGYIYNSIKNKHKCKVKFIIQDSAIVEFE